MSESLRVGVPDLEVLVGTGQGAESRYSEMSNTIHLDPGAGGLQP